MLIYRKGIQIGISNIDTIHLCYPCKLNNMCDSFPFFSIIYLCCKKIVECKCPVNFYACTLQCNLFIFKGILFCFSIEINKRITSKQRLPVLRRTRWSTITTPSLQYFPHTISSNGNTKNYYAKADSISPFKFIF